MDDANEVVKNHKSKAVTSSVVFTTSNGSKTVTSPPNVEGYYDVCPYCGSYIPVFYFGKRCPICREELEKKE